MVGNGVARKAWGARSQVTLGAVRSLEQGRGESSSSLSAQARWMSQRRGRCPERGDLGGEGTGNRITLVITRTATTY